MRLKVYNPENSKVAECEFAEDAACLVALYGDGASIRYGRHVLWTEGKEEFAAGESYDRVRDVCHERIERIDRPVLRSRYDMTDAATATGMYDND
jgi:hypothetical protein